ncbi:MAG: SdpI family protein [Patescibacteria group bacterium]|nr:SdpI family protein [Patescibacteria group bacterium]MDE2116260.1 SdpI family protein [Patescibacteria group bacterium]
MNPKISGLLIFIIILATFITGAIVYPHIGDFGTTFGLPIVLVILWGLWALSPAIDPVAKGFPGFRHVYDFFWILLSALLAYAYSLVISKALGQHVDGFHAVIPATAVLFFVIGALLPRIKRNWFFGIRTPWTLSSDEDWARTHRFSRPLFMIAAVVILVGAWTPRDWSIGLIVGPVLLAAIISVLYSYFTFRRA